ncbi:hypothetical protein CHCC14820_0614 [Bacillus paralicheniformis]|uniref:Uncharacterized protein n=1 Tax=Bacillus paralicheniformis TaxID=1648923 RepID=A0A6I7TX91_9BACI|nr:hypothetical protein SC10_B2orf00798 [Bacillus paralicheniformis]OLF90846.1 hypothetical protein B4121_3059 [Bacillus paralicheniformis]OLG01391.1 hypothetical protein B4125_3891 [Bacillus paralicheniformis]TWJ39798.1 hypothetical protein CHCC5027_1379 [Bacillus paralicheniformis]TWJ65706.1 hypothetical protein CHCC5022_3247 [Bacillus paralicheniformis]
MSFLYKTGQQQYLFHKSELSLIIRHEYFPGNENVEISQKVLDSFFIFR